MTAVVDKVVPKSKESEWRGLDRISAVVHGMRCIWREQEKDDIGIDGEIELCVDRLDGQGRAGTGKIIKVQSKSGAHYVVGDSPDSFEMPARRADLDYWNGANLPVLVVVYHPTDDRLYWVDVQTFIADNPDALKEPYRLRFNKVTDVFDESAYPRLREIVQGAPERVALDVTETLYTNALPILELPTSIFRSVVLPEKRQQFRQRLTGFVPPHSYRDGRTITFTDPTKTTNALKEAISDEPTPIPLGEWLEEAGENENCLRFLMKRLLHKRLHELGLKFDPEKKRYFFPLDPQKEATRQVRWKNPRTGRSPSRAVAQKYEYPAFTCYWHLALEVEFLRIDEKWALILEPMHHFTTNGADTWHGKKANSFMIRRRAREFNAQYLNHVLFWSSFISGGREEFWLELDKEQIIKVGGRPLMQTVGFGIRTDQTSRGR